MADLVQAHDFELDNIISIILKGNYKLLILQFTDDFLHISSDVYEYMSSKLIETGHFADIFIAADSTYGSSVDDISAQHVCGDLLVYFGDDLSSSGSMPVLVAPPIKRLDP